VVVENHTSPRSANLIEGRIRRQSKNLVVALNHSGTSVVQPLPSSGKLRVGRSSMFVQWILAGIRNPEEKSEN